MPHCRNRHATGIFEDKGRIAAIEIKSGKPVMPADLGGINAFRDASGGGEKIRGIILHTGECGRMIGNNCYALPLGWMFPA